VDTDCDPGYACEDGFCMPDSLNDGDILDGDEPDGDSADGDMADGDSQTGKPCRNHSECNDGTWCNGTERCGVENRCVAGTPPCDDNIDCTDNICDETRNECTYQPNDARCSDQEPCNGNEICDPQAGCKSGTPPNCDDSFSCTTDSCVIGTGCEYIPNNSDCNDDIDCTIDTCEVGAGCRNTPSNAACADTIDCTTEICDAVQGCIVTPTNQLCDDGYSCTIDTCISNDGCHNEPSAENCPQDWVCNPELPAANEDSGCAPTPECSTDSDCDDARYCTGVEACVDFLCVPGTPIDCNDNVTCTEDSCNEETDSCVNTALDSRCRDNNVCNGMETCDSQLDCQAGQPLNCNDNVECTTDNCDPATGCSNTPVNAVCNDGVACTDDTCHLVNGCTYTPNPANCNDQVPCTTDVCSPTTGCSNTPDDSYCNDGFDCTTETCTLQFNCVYELDNSKCIDAISCTADACVQGQGCAHTPNDDLCGGDMMCNPEIGCIDPECTSNADCSDNNVCTGTETCVDFSCVAGTPLNCYAQSGGSHFNAICNGGCQFSCHTNYFDCNANLGTISGDGCEIGVTTLASLGVEYTGNTCTTGVDRINEYSGSCPGYDNGWYEDGPEVIYKWTAPSTVSDDLVVSTDASSFDPDIWVLTDPCSASSCIMYEAYDSGSYFYAQFRPIANQTYYFVVDGFDGGCGSYSVGADWYGNVSEDCEHTGQGHHVTFILIMFGLGIWLAYAARRRRI
jgi:hypothetical protein